jgi:hypothetical protein
MIEGGRTIRSQAAQLALASWQALELEQPLLLAQLAQLVSRL